MSTSNSAPVNMLCAYHPKKGREAELEALVRKHGDVLRKTGLITSDPVRTWKAIDKRGHGDKGVYFLETFQWRDGEASTIAHQTPEVMAMWEPMGEVLETLALTMLEPLTTA